MPCGTGKTLVQLWAAERLSPRTVLVLVPSLALLSQTLGEWSCHTSWGDRFEYLCVCSDPTVSAEQDAITIRSTDVSFHVDTDPAIVRRFLNRPATDGVRVVFSTYQSAPVVARGFRGLAPFDLGIFDEAHKTTGVLGKHVRVRAGRCPPADPEAPVLHGDSPAHRHQAPRPRGRFPRGIDGRSDGLRSAGLHADLCRRRNARHHLRLPRRRGRRGSKGGGQLRDPPRHHARQRRSASDALGGDPDCRQ